MNNKVIKFDLDPKTLKVKELLNKDFLELEVKAISTAYPNRNGSHFTLEALQKAIPTFYNKPLLGSFSINQDDFRGHEGDLSYDEELDDLYYDYTDEKSETPLGLIRGDDKVEIYQNKKDGLYWLKFTCAIWVKYNYKQVKKLLKSKDGHKKISVEIEVVDSYIDDDGIEVINEFIYDGCTLLGDKYETGIADASMTILDMVDNAVFQKKQQALCFAYNSFDKNNVNKVEILDQNVQDSNIENINYSSDNEAIENEAPLEEITMESELSEEGGEVKMNLTAQMKMSLLEQYIVKYYNEMFSEEEVHPWVWVNDIDDNYIYFSVDEVAYRSEYQINESEEDEDNKVTVDLDNKERVVRSWTVFSHEESYEENKETESCETEECESCGDSECESCGNKSNEECESDNCHMENDVCPECGENPCECEAKCEESCKEKFDSDPIDLNEEPESDQGSKSMEEIIAQSTASFGAPEVQTEAEQLGDANEEVVSMMENVVDKIIDMPVDATLSVSKGPNGETAKVISEPEKEIEADVDQPDDSAKEEIFESKSTVEVDGEQMDINMLFEKYSEIKNMYEELANTIKVQSAKSLVVFGENFVNSDSNVDDENKKNFVEQITNKCMSYELSTEDDVIKFAKGLLAMYYYENRVVRKEDDSKDFGIDIQHPVQNTIIASNNKLKDAINKLNHTTK